MSCVWHSRRVPFRVLFVCTGNICRSPVAERLFVARVAEPSILAASAGMRGLSGYPIDASSAYALQELGIDPAGHVAQRVTAELTAAADLILTAETAHRSGLVQSEPRLFRRTFTLREFARLGAEFGPLESPWSIATLTSRVAEIAGQRGRVESPVAGADEIADPFGGSLDVARACVREIADAVDRVIAALGLGACPRDPVPGTVGS